MVLIVGGEGSGKRSFAQTLGFAPEEMADGVLDERPVVFHVEKMVFADVKGAPELLELGVPAMRILVLGYACNGLSTLIATYLQAVGRVRGSMVINLSRQLAGLVPMMWLLDSLFGVTGIWAAFPVTEVLTLILACILLRRCRVELPQAAA